MADFELPDKIRGDLSDDYFRAVGVLVHTVTLLEVRIENLARKIGRPVQRRLARLQFADPTAFCAERASECEEPLRSELVDYLGRVAEIREYRYAVVHSKAPSGTFAWRYLRGEDASLCDEVVFLRTSVAEMRKRIGAAVDLILEGERMEPRVPSLPDGRGMFEVPDLLPHTASRWPTLSARAHQASLEVAGIEALAQEWRAGVFADHLPRGDHVRSLSARLAWLSVLICERSMDLCKGTLAELEQQRPFSAAAAGRAQMEIVGNALLVGEEIESILDSGNPDISRLDRLTRSALAAMPHAFGGSGAGGYPQSPGRFIAAGERAFGAHFKDNYELLSTFAHPTGLMLAMGDAENLPHTSISLGFAELLVTVVADGGHNVGHTAQRLMDRLNVDITFPQGRRAEGPVESRQASDRGTE